MKLSKLINNIEIVKRTGNADPEITSIKMDSRKVAKGDLFVAIPGYKDDGFKFIGDAVKNGASAVVAENTWENNGVVSIQIKDARKSLARIVKAFYEHPDEKLKLFGITGTNGKTTTAHLIWSILKESNFKPSLLGTIQHNIMGKVIEANNTTPESSDLYSFFRETLNAGGDSIVMEVSSHALALSRVEGIKFSKAVFTNLTHDHLDFHKDFEDYFNAKTKLFTEHLKENGHAIINVDDDYGVKLVAILKNKRPDIQVITYGFNNDADISPIKHDMSWDGISLTLKVVNKTINIKSPLCGKFNISNIMAALGAAFSEKINLENIVKTIDKFKNVPGRFQNIRMGQDFAVVIDYAHTPDALERLLTSAKYLTKGKLISVFGCGGDRDKKKRPIMGSLSEKYADITIVTSDNPRTENPDEIISNIMAGIKNQSNVIVEKDRKKAIEAALKTARENDCVVIAGKGHENYQIIGKEKTHFDDSEIAGDYIKNEILKAGR